MKLPNFVFTLILVALSLTTISAFAQDKPEMPKDGFEIALSAQKVSLKAGETQTITAELIRSKRFSKTNIELVATSSTEALEIKITPSQGKSDLYDVVIYAKSEASAGDFTFTLMGKSAFLRKGKLINVAIEGKIQDTNRENK